MSIAEIADLKQAFSDSALPYKVDLVLWSETSENFKQLIASNHRVISLAQTA